MKKIKCVECGKINVYDKKDEFIYCSKCRKKIDLMNEQKKKSKLKYVLIIFSCVVLLSFITLLFLFRINQIDKNIYVSEILKVCKDKDECILNKVIKKKILTIRNFNMNDVHYQTDKKEYKVNIEVGNKKEKLIFNIKDDMGPKINSEYCEFNPNEEVDLKSCVKIEDFIDGEILLDNENVKYDVSKVDNTKEGKYYVTISVVDSSNIEVEEDVEILIAKVQSRAIEVISSKEKGYTGEKITFNINWTPGNTYDKTVKWQHIRSDGVTGDMSSNVFSVGVGGDYKVCATTNDTQVKACKEISIYTTCKNRYDFYYDGGTTPKIDIGKQGDVCPGTYYLYVTTLNYNSIQTVTVDRGTWDNFETHYPFKDNGKVYVLNEGNFLDVETGITKVQLIKR